MAERQEVSKGDVHRSPLSSPTGASSEKIVVKLKNVVYMCQQNLEFIILQCTSLVDAMWSSEEFWCHC